MGETAQVPKPQLYAGILIFATLDVFGMRQSPFDIFLLYAIGLIEFMMRRDDFPTAPVIIGMILGSRAEAQLRCALAISQGDPMIFLAEAAFRDAAGAYRFPGHRAVGVAQDSAAAHGMTGH